ncbi:leishmanolysin-related zinc metalloendopeptidase [Marinibacterium sp. SX1]|uniref:leishmanolysin-related zinc metalloendopeptidase n=1 Tax=Marinibacterium sp. SX1 TaxID=3388424 RepID=UPI003D16A72A
MRSILSNDLTLRDLFVFADTDTDTPEPTPAETATPLTRGETLSLRGDRDTLRATQDDDGGLMTVGFQVKIAKAEVTMPKAESIALPAGDLINQVIFGADLESERGSGPLRSRLITDTYTSGAQNGDGFNVQIDFRGQWDDALKQSFIDAADLISSIITGDIADARVPGFGIFRSNIVDDVRIDASLADIDGSGGVLGQAGPTAYRTDSLLPATGIMEFDVADAADFDAINMFNDIVFHEMMHVLGFGTLWEAMGLVTNNGNGTSDFNGANVATAYAAEFGGSGPSIETEGGPGTAGGHWNEDGSDGYAFENEIMTGYIDVTGNYLSNTTIAALEDMGYETVFDASNPLDATAGLDLSILNDHLA